MRIVIATPLYPPDIGGPATYAKTLEVELPKRGVEVLLVKFGDVRGWPKGLAHIVYAIKLFRALRDADLLLALDPVSTGFPASLAALIRGKRFAVKIVGDYAWEQGSQRYGVKDNLDVFVKTPSNKYLAQVGMLRMVQKFVAKRAWSIIVPSNYLKSIIVAWGIPSEKIHVVYNAFDGKSDIASREEMRSELGVSGQIIVSAGRLVPWKGFSVLMDTTLLLRAEYPSVKLMIAGSGPDERELRRLIVEKDLSDNVVLLGSLERSLLMKYIRAADCFVLNTGYEGLSHQLLEVMALQTPIVTTNVGGNPELITEMKTGRLVEYNNMAQLVNAIQCVFESPEEAKQMASAAGAFVADFTVSRMVDGSLSVFREATKNI